MKFEKIEMFVTNLYDKTEYVIHITNLKQALNHGLILRKVHKVIKFKQKAWLKPYIDMNTKLRQKAKNSFEEDFFKLIIMQFLEKTMENFRKHRNIKFATTERRRNYLVSEPNYHITKFFAEKLLAMKMRKTQIIMNSSLYLKLPILDLSQTIMCEF